MDEMRQTHQHQEPTIIDSDLKSVTICTSPSATKVVRVNIHYIANDDGTGNFKESHDGLGNNNYNGYLFADDIVHWANELWASHDNGTVQPWLYSGTAQPSNPPMRIRLILNGVYFHNDSYQNNIARQADFSINNTYGVDKANTVNVYLTAFTGAGSGVACGLCDLLSYDCASGQSIRMHDAWNVYGSWSFAGAKRYAAATLNHELGHIFNLYHDWGGDGCSDTPPHNNCWTLDLNNTNCDTWPEMSNNIMSYTGYSQSLTPCQISRCHSCLDSTNNNYIHSCSGCIPANAFFYLNPEYCRSIPNQPLDVTIDARGSFNESTYAIEIFEVAAPGSNTSIGNYYAGQFSGQVGLINLRTFCGYNFAINKHYRVKLSAINSCLPQSDMIKWVHVKGECTPTSYPPPTESLQISQNPDNLEIYVQATSEGEVAMQLLNLAGQSLWADKKVYLSSGINVLHIPMDMPAGLYVLLVQDANKTQSHKITIKK